MLKKSVILPFELSIFADHPLVPPLGVAMLHGPITKGLADVPVPLVTQPQVEKSAFEVMVMAACPPAPARAGVAGRANSTVNSAVAITVNGATKGSRIRSSLGSLGSLGSRPVDQLPVNRDLITELALAGALVPSHPLWQTSRKPLLLDSTRTYASPALHARCRSSMALRRSAS